MKNSPIVSDVAKAWASAYAKSLSEAELSLEEQQGAKLFEQMLRAMYLMALADGKAQEEELVLLTKNLEALLGLSEEKPVSAEKSLPLLKLNATLKNFHEEFQASSLDACLKDICHQLGDHEARQTAFGLATAIAFVDRKVEPGEITAIETLAKGLELSSDDSQRIMSEVLDSLDSDAF